MFDHVADELTRVQCFSCGSGATEDDIENASRELDVPIAGGFREFLRRFGWAGIPGYEFWGLGPGIHEYDNLVVMTRSERTEVVDLPLPHHLLPIMNDGAGNLVCLDTKASPEEPPVVMWYHDDPDGPDQTPVHMAPDFVSWLMKVLEERASG